MEYIEKNLSKHLVERKIKDFNQKSKEFSFFVRTSQFVSPRPKTLSELKNATMVKEADIHIGTILYGANGNELVWLGEIIDSN